MKPTFDEVESKIDFYEFAFCETSTVCFMKSQAGMIFVGESHCFSLEDYNIEVGKETAYQDALNKFYDAEIYLARVNGA